MHAVRAAIAHDGERFREGGATVLVDGGRIAGVEPVGFEVPDGVPVTTYDGTLLPGLVDAHVHLVADATLGGLERAGALPTDALDALVRESLAQQAAAGVTTVRDLGDVAYCTLPHREAARAGEPRIVAAGPPITTVGGHCHYLGGAVTGPDGIRAAVDERVRRRVDVVKVMASGGMTTPGTDVFGVQFSDDDLGLLVELSHATGMPVLAHAHSLAAAWQALGAGVDGIEHFTCLAEDSVVVPEELLAEVAARGVAVDLTMGNNPAVMAAMGAPPPAIQEMLDRIGLGFDQVHARRLTALEAIRRHGLTMVAGVDAGVSPPKAHGNLWLVVVDLVEGGYPVEEAVASATGVAARQCGIGELTGSLRPGLDADLLVVAGDLRQDPFALGRPTAVWVRGVPVRPRAWPSGSGGHSVSGASSA
ncbi:amidohydrolase family protein [Nocardioides sp. MAHUQ-72]|uniref:amidohydrolase family protein n=1 Tax=unclassified Nocardioides TaxID=2615069 RepID=UPI003618A710